MVWSRLYFRDIKHISPYCLVDAILWRYPYISISIINYILGVSNEYICPHCWVQTDRVISGATLIIFPAAIYFNPYFRGVYIIICPHCWVQTDRVKSGATLIVSPAAIYFNPYFRGEYICPHCWVQTDWVKSGATLMCPLQLSILIHISGVNISVLTVGFKQTGLNLVLLWLSPLQLFASSGLRKYKSTSNIGNSINNQKEICI